jgi:DNA-directed RNA polymerase subunit alpha
MILFPKPPKVVKKEGNQAVFEIEGLYPGYGVTLGNALRRVLYSSLPGAAVVRARIGKAPHEFSTIPYVFEDVLNICLNLKKMRFKVFSEEPQIGFVKASGEKDIKAGDFKFSSQVEIVNPDLHIASLTDKKAELEIEVVVQKGVGYELADTRRKKEKLAIGQIELDAIYSPVKRVKYEIENMRVGERTDFDRLFLTIETDGSWEPEEAFNYACQILIDHFKILQEPFSKKAAPVKKLSKNKEKTEETEKEIKDVLSRKVENLKISQRALNALLKNKVMTVGDILAKKESGLSQLEGIGEGAIKEIKKELKKLNLELT